MSKEVVSLRRFFTRVTSLLLVLALPCLALSSGAATAEASAALTDKEALLLLPEEAATPQAVPALSAASYALLEPQSGTLLAAKDADTRRPMASTTKIMTALVVLERCDPDETVTVSPEAVGIEGSSVYLFAGERITVRTLLYALLLSSANDAAAALACHVAGGIADFAALMNEKAAALGLSDTHFCNPHGLHDEAHYTTARELALLTAAAMKNALFSEIVATQRYSAPQQGTDAHRLFLNHNRLLREPGGIVGVKTGFTKKSGRCLVTAATRDGLSLIAVTLNAPNDWQDHRSLLDWGFSAYVAAAPVPLLSPIPVVGGTVTAVALRPARPFYAVLPARHAALSCTVERPRFLYAGFAEGQAVGRIVYRLGDTVLAEIPLLTASGAPTLKAQRPILDRLRKIFRR